MTHVDARERAVQALDAADARGDAPDAADVADLGKRATGLVEGVCANLDAIDAVIGRIASGWRVERMPVVDRNVLRLGVYELLHTDTPVGVVVSEAVEIAKRYSTTKSGAFVNGVLGRLVDELAKGDADPAV